MVIVLGGDDELEATRTSGRGIVKWSWIVVQRIWISYLNLFTMRFCSRVTWDPIHDTIAETCNAEMK